MIAAHGDDTRESLAMLGLAGHMRVCGRVTHKDAVVALFDLLDGPFIIVPVLAVSFVLPIRAVSPTRRRGVLLRSDGNVTTVNDSGPTVKGVRGKRNVVTAAEAHFA